MPSSPVSDVALCYKICPSKEGIPYFTLAFPSQQQQPFQLQTAVLTKQPTHQLLSSSVMESTSSPGTVSQAPQPPTPPALPKGHSEVRDATFLNLYRLISQELSTRDDTSVYTAFQRGYAKTSPYYEQALDNTLGENWDQYNGLPLSIALSRMDKGIIDETVTVCLDAFAPSAVPLMSCVDD